MKKNTIKHFIINNSIGLFYRKPMVMSDIETLDYIIQNRCSISRYGDGELYLILGHDLSFQELNEQLVNKLKNIKTTNNFLVCIPDIFNKKRFNKNLIIKEEYLNWARHRSKYSYIWCKLFNKENVCGDAFISRFYLRKKDKKYINVYVEKMKKLWDKRDIVFIEGENSRLGYGNDLFNNASSIRRILAPAVNAFSKYDEIIAAVKKHVDKKDLLILALGPTATVMSYELSGWGYQALDLGHVDIEYEWYLLGVTKKVPILHKHVNECNSLGNTEASELNNEYLSQIIDKIM